MTRTWSVCFAVGLLLLVTAIGSVGEEFAACRPALGLPSSGGTITPEGSLDVSGVGQMNIPVAYTLHQRQHRWGLYWGNETDSEDIGSLLSLSVGHSHPGRGLSLSALLMKHEGLSGGIQKQLWPETDKWPALAAGVYDLTDRVDRGGYVVATRQLGGRRSRQLELGWPPDEVAAVSAHNPSTWGQLIISNESLEIPPPLTEARHLLEGPLLSSAPRIDGIIGAGEWEGAAAQVQHFAPGEEMMMMAGHDDRHLYICLCIPSDHSFGPGHRAELFFELPQEGASSLSRSHQRYSAQVSHTGETVQSFSRGSEGTWHKVAEGTGTEAVFRTAVSSDGDGAWHWPVFEFAISLQNLRTGEGNPTALGFAARITVPAGSAYEAAGRKYVDMVRFPSGRSSYRSPYNHIFATRPDLWGKAVFEAISPDDETVPVTVVGEPVQIDGQLNEPLWQETAAASYTVFGDLTQSVRVVADDDNLYVGVHCQISRGRQSQRSCQVYMDPLGDEGLLPRPDDRVYRLDVATAAIECLQWQDDSWSQPGHSRFTAAAHSTIEHKQMIDTYEFAIPLRELDRPASDATLGLAVQTQYEAQPSARPVQPATAKAYLTAGWGGGPFSGHGFGGLSLGVGRRSRGIIEYDGEGLNLGYITQPAGANYNLMLGIHNFAGPHDSRLTIGLCQQSQF